MIEQPELNSDFGDIEELVRAAGGYLDVSDDLRPRTLEEARYDRLESSTRSWIAVLAVVVAFLALGVSQFRAKTSRSPFEQAVSDRADVDPLYANGDQLFAAAQRNANVDAGSSLVDSFRELRQRQARLIEDAF